MVKYLNTIFCDDDMLCSGGSEELSHSFSHNTNGHATITILHPHRHREDCKKTQDRCSLSTTYEPVASAVPLLKSLSLDTCFASK